ncbi:MAG: hypothetical protein ACRC62_04815, partial [Microcoleus sp.]
YKQCFANTFGSATVNTWYIIMAWYDAISNNSYICINNGTIDTLAIDPSFHIRETAAGVHVGTFYDNGQYGLAGRVDCLGFGKNIPTPAQRAAIYNGGLGYAV